jgi:hypothetical protein
MLEVPLHVPATPDAPEGRDQPDRRVWLDHARTSVRSPAAAVNSPLPSAGDVAIIPGNVEHEGFFPEDTDVIDIFAPPREDFLTRDVPPYMRSERL